MPRTRHSSEAKWLANELAAISGELSGISEQLERLTKRRTELTATYRALSQVAWKVGAAPLAANTAPVHAQGPYGGHGQLRAALADVLKAVAPQALDTVTLTEAVAARYSIVLASRGELSRFRKNSVSRALRKMEADGLVERLHDAAVTPSLVGVWRWCGEVLPTLQEMACAAGTAGVAEVAEEKGGQVP